MTRADMLRRKIIKHEKQHKLKRTTIIIISFFLVVFLKLFVVDIIVVQGSSMEPTLYEGQIHILLKCEYWQKKPQNGDVVVVQHGTEKYIKRIVACPGEIPPGEDEILPEGRYYIMGDNRPVSIDSRSFGAVSEELILGRVLLW